MCEHGNFRGSCVACKRQMEEIFALMRSPEEELEEALRRKDMEVLRYGEPGREVIVHGTKHEFSLEPIAEMIDALDEAKPDLVIVEGTAKPEIDAAMTPEEILKKYGEQHYVRRLAADRGIEVKSWDVPWADQFREILKKHDRDAVIGWVEAYATKHVINQKGGEHATAEEVRGLMRIALSKETLDSLRAEFFDIELDPDKLDLDAIIKKFSGGKEIAALEARDAENLGTPWHSGTTNDVIRDMNAIRDRNALKMIDEARRVGKKTFVLAGNDHVLTWEKSLEKMFGK